MLTEVAPSLLYAPTASSSFASDQAHTSFIERSLAFLRTADSLIESEDLRAYLRLVSESLNRMDQARKRLVTIAEMDIPFYGTTWCGSDLIVLGRDFSVYQLTLGEQRFLTRLSDSAKAIRTNPSSELIQSAATNGGNLHCDASNRLWLFVPQRGLWWLDGSTWSSSIDLTREPTSEGQQLALFGLSPAERFVIRDMSHQDAGTLRLYLNGRPTSTRSIKEIADEVARQWKFTVCDMSSVEDDNHTWTVVCRAPLTRERVSIAWGSVELETSTLKIERYVRQNGSADIDETLSSGVERGVVRRDGRLFYFVASDGFDPYQRHDTSYELKLWLWDEDGALISKAAQRMVVDFIPENADPMDWLSVIHPAVVSCRSGGGHDVICTSWIDAIYWFDVQGKALAPLFYPPEVGLAQSGSGFVSASVTGSNRFVIVRTGEANDK